MNDHRGKQPALIRDTKVSERQGLWLVLALVVGLPLSLLAIASSQGVFEKLDPVVFASALRGYTGPGLAVGLVALLLLLVTFAYSVRKRRRPVGKSATMMAWLWVHVYGGLLAFVLATVHAGPGVVSFEFTSGKVLWFALLAVVVSGVAWRMVYALVPPVAGPKVVNYSKQGSARRAVEQATEIEKLAAGKSQAFHQVKEWLLAAPRHQNEVMAMAPRLPPAEQPLLAEMVRLSEARHRALSRVVLQDKYTRILQGWRVLHVPIALALVGLLVIHVVGALELPQRVLKPGTVTEGALASFAPSTSCKTCHTAIYAEWTESMHAHALTSPLTVAQNNLDVRISLKGAASPDPKRICIQCHAPAGALMTSGDTLPLSDGAIMNDGISCAACHTHSHAANPGEGAFFSGLLSKLEPGRTYYGPLASPVGNAFHKSEPSPMFKEPETTCASCHDVHLDRDRDGKIVKGVDLVLQTTYDEFGEYRAAGGTDTCVTCHMPVRPTQKRAADGALIPFEQDRDAPPREVRDHSFAGVDYPLDTVAQSDSQKPKREALLRSAAQVAFESAPVLEGGKLKFQVAIRNTTGHNLPTGFAFARQMWLEVEAKSASGETIFVSGKLANAAADLCDASSLDDAPAKHMVGCTAPDPELVNIQLKLMDKIAVLPNAAGQPQKDERGEYVVVAAAGGQETVLQHPEGGPIARKRPATKEALVPLRPLEKRAFAYAVAIPHALARGTSSLKVRLLFRNIPPYFIRAMAALQTPDEKPSVGPLVDRLQIVEMASLKASF